MKLRLLSEEERSKHLELHPEDAEVGAIYEARYVQDGMEKTTLIDSRIVPVIESAIEYGKREAQLDIQASLGIIKRKKT